MALQEEMNQKVDRAQAALGEVRDLLASANGRATKLLGDAMRRGIDAHQLCGDAKAGRDNPVCAALRFRRGLRS